MKTEGHKFPALKESDAMFSADTAPEWADGTMCHRCRVTFSIVQRKHHCRACGQVFCQQCSSKVSTLPKFGFEKEVRVCESCYEQFNKPATSLSKETELPAEYLSSSLAQQQQVPPRKTEEELREEEELQLALALSQSEAEQKEKDQKRSKANSAPVERVTYPPPPSPGLSPARVPDEELDPELAKYLNRQYWEQRQLSAEEHGSRINVTSPSAPNISSPMPQKIITTKQQNGEIDTEMEMFVNALQSQVEIFVNRMKSNSSRGRSIANDSSVQTWFMNITAMHSKLLRYIQEQDDKRVYYEGLQDKVAQIKESRAALDALREEHREKLKSQAEEAERQRQLQMAHKLEIMRKKKQDYLQYQRQLALQRIQEQEREMQMRQEQQKQQYIMGGYQSVSGFIGPTSQGSPVRHVQYQNPGCNYNSISPSNPGIFVYGQAPMPDYSIQNYRAPAVGSIPPQIMSPIGNQEQQQQPKDSAVQGQESLGHVTISGPGMISQIGGTPIRQILPQNTPHMRLPNQQSHSAHVEISQGIQSHGPQSQVIPTQGPPSQGFPKHVGQPPVQQSVQPQGLSGQMATHKVPGSQIGKETQCPPGATPTLAHIKPGQVGLSASVQPQAPPPSSSRTILQQSTSNTSIPCQDSGSIQMPAPNSNNISAQSSQHIPNLKVHGIHVLQGTPQTTASNHPIHFQSPIQSKSTEQQQQKQESKLDTAELISFD
ncbi:hepatocyte growth factor-regulated tyrosine kinase substrate isoform X2 [Belonocnema kinseyi]|nr:hepatocyte growth factor-regulated tyrosine kinase substrate isoform X2 [Belonocnema kinseyi]